MDIVSKPAGILTLTGVNTAITLGSFAYLYNQNKSLSQDMEKYKKDLLIHVMKQNHEMQTAIKNMDLEIKNLKRRIKTLNNNETRKEFNHSSDLSTSVNYPKSSTAKRKVKIQLPNVEEVDVDPEPISTIPFQKNVFDDDDLDISSMTEDDDEEDDEDIERLALTKASQKK
jgi:hypothetical protein